MAATVAGAGVELKKAQVRYKREFDRPMRPGNSEVRVGDYVWLDVQDEKGKEKLVRRNEGPFPVLDRKTRTFVIQRRDLVERVNSNRVGWVPAPEIPKAKTQDGLEATPEDLAVKNREGHSWLVEAVVDHRRTSAGIVQFKVEWQGDYATTWDPRENLPEELVSRYIQRRHNTGRQRAAT